MTRFEARNRLDHIRDVLRDKRYQTYNYAKSLGMIEDQIYKSKPMKGFELDFEALIECEKAL